MKPRVAFRYLEQKYAEEAMARIFRFGNLEEYRKMEIEYGDTSRGDQFDGSAYGRLDNLTIEDSKQNPDLMNNLWNNGIKVKASKGITLNNISINNTLECYIHVFQNGVQTTLQTLKENAIPA